MGLVFNNLFGGNKPKDGELTINLNLTIKIEADGSLSVVPTAAEKVSKKESTPAKDVEYELPDLGIGENNLINFGKNV